MKVQEKTFKVVDYHDLEEFVHEAYDLPTRETSWGSVEKPYSVIDALESSNDTSHEITATITHFDLEKSKAGVPYEEAHSPGLADYEQEELDEWLADPWSGSASVHLVLSDLAIKGKIEPGAYLIEVCW